jgi:hypothetical protein
MLLLKFPRTIASLVFLVIAFIVLLPFNTCYKCCRKTKNIIFDNILGSIMDILKLYLLYPYELVKSRLPSLK